MTPTFLKILQQVKIDSLQVGFTGGEIVSDVFSDSIDIVNIYGPSEFAYPTLHFTLDKAYSNTSVGYPAKGAEILLLDEKKEEAKEGRLCIYLPYFRGYHNLPDAESFETFHGKRFFMSYDYATLDEKGRYTILGRAGITGMYWICRKTILELILSVLTFFPVL